MSIGQLCFTRSEGDNLVPNHISPWPDWTDHVLAKSADLGGETLAEHTWDVLCRLADQYRLRPDLPEQVGEPRLWTRLFWACFLHDFGKAASGFQAMLRKELERWPYRHEILSLAFVEWVFPPSHSDYQWIVAAIASHHKDFAVIEHKYIYVSEETDEAIQEIVSQIDDATLLDLWRWLSECANQWINALGMTAVVELQNAVPLDRAQALYSQKALRLGLRTFAQWYSELDQEFQITFEILAAIQLRGLILTADHSASGHAGEFPSLQLRRDDALGQRSSEELYPHQRGAEAIGVSSAILTAPTGSGKTEASLLWAAAQIIGSGGKPPRLFYVLPYQASMNAMEQRLRTRHFSEKVPVGLQHGRALQSIYHSLMRQGDDTPQEAAKKAALAKNLAHLNYHPVRIFSPYEMLKAAYRLKGFETQLVDYQGALFIFDEIHAYEAERLALIITFINWLGQYCQARFFVMTATLPPMVRQVLQEALPGCAEIRADEVTFRQSQRHQVKLLDGELLRERGIEAILQSLRNGKSVLVCLNTVKRAKVAFQLLCECLEQSAIKAKTVLVHGRFNAEDRNEKERKIIEGAGVGLLRAEPVLVVSTQVVEVSLNIDLDTIYTDPAPLEALLQRFGRVNRGRGPNAPLVDVHVFRSPNDGQRVYQDVLVQRALEALETIDGKPIDEAQVSVMLERIYTGDTGQAWLKKYRESEQDFSHSILRLLRPFQSADPGIARKFYELFDGIDVLPSDKEEEFWRRIRESGNYIDASMLLVSISWGQYMQLHKLQCTVTPPDSDEWPKVVDVPYNSQSGLDIEAVIQQRKAAGEHNEDY